MKKKIYSLMIILAGILWGFMGLFVRVLSKYGFTSMQITAIRLISGSIMLIAFVAVYDRRLFRISLRDIPVFLGTGILSVFMMSWLYFSSILNSTMAVAAILLYTAPVWVLVSSVIFYKEKLTYRKIIALILAVGGCAAVSGFSADNVSPAGVLYGLGSGFAYALYSIIGKYALSKYSPVTTTMYSFSVAAVLVLFTGEPLETAQIVMNNFDYILLVEMIGIGAVTVFGAYLLYTIGLTRLPAGKASILASVEPLSATLLGILVYGEMLTFGGLLGIIMIMTAIFILNSQNE